MKLSVLDQSPVSKNKTAVEALKETTELAKETEKLGYHRFWVSEHHSTKSLAGSSPEVLIAHLAANTSHMKIGSGGVLLPHYSSYKVAENFRMLESLNPGRIDLGLGRAPGGMPNVTRALADGNRRDIDRYPEQIDELTNYLNGRASSYHVHATPLGDTKPDIWLLGSSGGSARIAANKGLAFSFAHFINGNGGSSVVDKYMERFSPSEYNDTPKTNVAVFVVCGETEEEAEYLASSLDLAILLIEQGKSGTGFPSPDEALQYPYSVFDKARIRENRNRIIVGDPKQVRQQIEELGNMYQTNEVIVNTITYDFNARLKSYRLLAEEFGL
ncbi:LLM class flavin-dependent oxidoreductase [Alkalihalobacillus sp. CinArs1]|uniref:LLM class flavin-dependent oxidoreductase n=1 Tax=Alkalihalobacillus sp. CinArs1 TaxID=2995314 RepID=UPI0022DE8B40|nr:LLM class flavin-dependent oxidoreductase [Alkalihalobacillus sp. CinArs1]